MAFWKAIFGILRRWFVGPPIVVVSLIVGGALFHLMPTRYMSTTSMVLTTPATGGMLSSDPERPLGLTNPLLQFNDGLRTTAAIIILSLNTPEVLAQMGATKDGTTEILINDGRTNPELLGLSTDGPFIYVEVESDTPGRSRLVANGMQARVQAELTRYQKELKAPKSTYISLTDVVPPTVPEMQLTGKLTAGAAGLLGSLAVLFGLAYAVQQVRASRRVARTAGPVRREAAAARAPEPEPSAFALLAESETAEPAPARPAKAQPAKAAEPAKPKSEPAWPEPAKPEPAKPAKPVKAAGKPETARRDDSETTAEIARPVGKPLDVRVPAQPGKESKGKKDAKDSLDDDGDPTLVIVLDDASLNRLGHGAGDGANGASRSADGHEGAGAKPR